MDEDVSSSKHWTTTYGHMPPHVIFSSKALHVTSSTEVTCVTEDSGSRRTFRCPLRSEESPSTISSLYNKLLSLSWPPTRGRWTHTEGNCSFWIRRFLTWPCSVLAPGLNQWLWREEELLAGPSPEALALPATVSICFKEFVHTSYRTLNMLYFNGYFM